MNVRNLILLLLCFVPACSDAPISNSESPPPNILFIIADDLGYGDLGVYGQKQIMTPNIDRLAVEGLRFTDFYAGSTVCAPSRSVLMTGQHTGHTYIRGNGKINLRPADVTVAEILKQSGYRTAHIGKWGLGHEGSDGMPTRKGFDTFFGYLDQSHAHNYYPSFLVRDEERVPLANTVTDEGPYGQGVAEKKLEYSHDLVIDEAMSFIENTGTEPFFLYLALTIPHANNEAADEGMEVPDLGPYAEKDWPPPQKGLAAMISRMDTDIGRLMDLLDRKGLTDNTVVFFTSDNGPHAEGGNNPDFFDSNGPLRGIKRDLYEGGIRVPMIVRWPGKVRPGSQTSHLAYFTDFLATASELANVEPPAKTDGISFLPTLLGKDDQASHPFLYWEFYERGSAQAVRSGKWKAIRKPLFSGEVELYDLDTDLGENQDVSTQNPEVARQLVEFMSQAHTPSELWQVK
ncbi:MAG: arylsulfatase [Acidobacteriota bacterium]|nr:MAG: arylsulfatase [Acidobacteriota bacterium]